MKMTPKRKTTPNTKIISIGDNLSTKMTSKIISARPTTVE